MTNGQRTACFKVDQIQHDAPWQVDSRAVDVMIDKSLQA